MPDNKKILRFDDGKESFMLNGVEIRFNPGDYSILERFKQASEAIKAKVETLGDDVRIDTTGSIAAADDIDMALILITDVEHFIRKQIDYIFDAEIADVAFGKQSCLSLKGGKPAYERLFDCLMPVVKSTLKTENAAVNSRVNSYTANAAKYKQNKNRKYNGKKRK